MRCQAPFLCLRPTGIGAASPRSPAVSPDRTTDLILTATLEQHVHRNEDQFETCLIETCVVSIHGCRRLEFGSLNVAPILFFSHDDADADVDTAVFAPAVSSSMRKSPRSAGISITIWLGRGTCNPPADTSLRFLARHQHQD